MTSARKRTSPEQSGRGRTGSRTTAIQAPPASPAKLSPTAGPILETDYVNTALPDRRGNWPKKIAGGKTLEDVDGPGRGWLNAHDTSEEFDHPLTGLSGTVVQEPHISGSDLPFLHPFGNDFEFHVAPDPQYAELVAPTMIDEAYVDSTARANTPPFNLNVKGVIGMEIDGGLVQGRYRPKLGDRTCLWGRWIVDAGHADFHTEIHPPLVMVGARAARSDQQKGQTKLQHHDATLAYLTTRPYLVSQDFGDGGVWEHLGNEVFKVLTGRSLLLEAHPRLMPKPFDGQNIVMFKLRPPTPRRHARDELIVEYALMHRSPSTAVQLVAGTGNDSVRVLVVLNSAGYDPPPEPRRNDIRLTVSDLEAIHKDAGDWYRKGIFAALLQSPTAAVIFAQGIETHTYSRLPIPVLGPVQRTKVADLRPVHLPPDSDQKYPIAGTIRVEWKRFDPTETPPTKRQTRQK